MSIYLPFLCSITWLNDLRQCTFSLLNPTKASPVRVLMPLAKTLPGTVLATASLAVVHVLLQVNLRGWCFCRELKRLPEAQPPAHMEDHVNSGLIRSCSQTIGDRNPYVLSSSLTPTYSLQSILKRRIQYFTWSCSISLSQQLSFPSTTLPPWWNSRNDWGKLYPSCARLSVGLNHHFSLSQPACRAHCPLSACSLESTAVTPLWSLPQSLSPPCISSAC